jgi:hypothetical protein
VANAGDVLSNVAFAVGGVWGLVFLCTNTGARQFADARERWAYVAVFLGLLLTAFGSSYYHLAPDDARLVWDRLPMTLAFMGLVSAMFAERISVPVGFYLLPWLLMIGAGSVVWWWHTEAAGAGDLRVYAAVQVYAVLVLPVLLLLPPRYTRGGDFLAIFGCYVLAKIFEAADRQIFWLARQIGGGSVAPPVPRCRRQVAPARGFPIGAGQHGEHPGRRFGGGRGGVVDFADAKEAPAPCDEYVRGGRNAGLKRRTYNPAATGSVTCQTTRPATMVVTGPPLKARPSKGELRDLLGDCFTS